VLIQVDGVRVPYGFSFGAQDAGRGDYVDIGLIKSVEFLRGPASALYGSDGLAGAVSFVTSDPADILGDKSFGGSLRTQYNSADEEFTQSGIVAGRSGAVSAMLAYTRRDFSELKNRAMSRAPASPHRAQSAGRPLQCPAGQAGLERRAGPPPACDRRVSRQPRRHRRAHRDQHQRRRVAGPRYRRRWRGTLDWTYDGTGLIEFARAAAYVQNAEDRQFSAEDRRTLADRTRLNTLENRVYGGSGEVRLGFSTGRSPTGW
jgi:hemoglobin/transferrin/lactoferrin receptor protein